MQQCRSEKAECAAQVKNNFQDGVGQGVRKIKYVKPRCYCPECKKEILPEVRDAPPNSKFDHDFIALFLVLNNDMGMSCRDISSFAAALWEIALSAATVSNSIRRLKEHCKPEGTVDWRKSTNVPLVMGLAGKS